MRTFLEIITPAASLQLLSAEEMRVAAGLAADDASQDAALAARGFAVSAAIASECNIAVGAGGDPTLRQETLRETFYRPCTSELMLARRHNVEITSVTIDGTLIDAAEYYVEPEPGILTRISTSGALIRWGGYKMVVVYKAGFATVPGDLKMAATDFYVSVSQGVRDPTIKSQEIEIPGLQTKRTDFWVGSVPGAASEGPVPDIVSGQLKRYRNSSLEMA